MCIFHVSVFMFHVPFLSCVCFSIFLKNVHTYDMLSNSDSDRRYRTRRYTVSEWEYHFELMSICRFHSIFQFPPFACLTFFVSCSILPRGFRLLTGPYRGPILCLGVPSSPSSFAGLLGGRVLLLFRTRNQPSGALLGAPGPLLGRRLSPRACSCRSS